MKHPYETGVILIFIIQMRTQKHRDTNFPNVTQLQSSVIYKNKKLEITWIPNAREHSCLRVKWALVWFNSP